MIKVYVMQRLGFYFIIQKASESQAHKNSEKLFSLHTTTTTA